MENTDAVLEQRGSRYGSFLDNAFISNDIKKKIKKRFLTPADKMQGALLEEYIDNLAQKLSRFVCEDIKYNDTLVDIEGYSKVFLKYCTINTALAEPIEIAHLSYPEVHSAKRKRKDILESEVHLELMSNLSASINSTKSIKDMAKLIIAAIQDFRYNIGEQNV